MNLLALTTSRPFWVKNTSGLSNTDYTDLTLLSSYQEIEPYTPNTNQKLDWYEANNEKNHFLSGSTHYWLVNNE